MENNDFACDECGAEFSVGKGFLGSLDDFEFVDLHDHYEYYSKEELERENNQDTTKPEKPIEKLDINDIEQLLNSEIGWCMENPYGVDKRYREGFVAGVRQSKRILTNAINKLKE